MAAAAWACIVLSGAAVASPHSRGARSAISPRYYASSADTEAASAPSELPTRRLASPWYHAVNCRYQLRFGLKTYCSNSITSTESYGLLSATPDRGSIAATIGSQIAQNRQAAQGSEKTRILLRLGLGLAVAYVGFLSLWFWMTRGRMARRRVVRF